MKNRLLLPVSLLLIFSPLYADPPLSEKDDSPILQEPSIESLITQLGAEKEKERAKAEQQLWDLGDKAIPFLREATKSEDPEISYRSKNLIPHIKARIPLDDTSILSSFLRLYANQSAERRKLVSSFLERSDLTHEEAISVLLIVLNSPNINDIHRSTQYAVRDILNNFTKSYLDNGDIKSAASVWQNTGIDPYFLQKYGAIIHNTGLSPDTTGMSDEDIAVLDAYLALLQGDREKALQAAPKENKWLQQLLSASNFDYAGNWDSILSKDTPLKARSPLELYILFCNAEINGNLKEQSEIINELKTQAKEFSSLKQGKTAPYNTMLAIKILYILGESKEAEARISQVICESIPFVSNIGKYWDLVSSPSYDITQLGVKKESLESILEFAKDLVQQQKEKKWPSQKDSWGRQSYNTSSTEKQVIVQKLLAVSFYLDSRGEYDSIKPLIMEFMKEDENLLEQGIYLFSNCMDARKWDMAFDVLSFLYENDIEQPEALSYMEKFLFFQQSNTNQRLYNEESIFSTGLMYMDAVITEEEISHQEKFRQLLILVGVIKGEEGESENLFQQFLHYIRKNENPEQVQDTINCIVPYFLNNNKAYFFRFFGTFPNAHITSIKNLSDVLLVASLCENYPKEFLKSHKNAYANVLKKHPLFFPSETNNDDEPVPSSNMEDISSMAMSYAVLLHHLGEKEEARRIADLSKLYYATEELGRIFHSYFLSYIEQTGEELLNTLTPYFSINSSYRSTQMFLMPVAGALQESGLTDKALFLAYNISGNINYYDEVSLTYCASISSFKERTKSLLLKEQKKHQESILSYKKAISICPPAQIHELYLSDMSKNSGYHPRRDILELYRSEWKKNLALLQKWPKSHELRKSLILQELLMNQFPEERSKLFDKLTEVEKSSLNKIETVFKLFQEKKYEEAKPIILEMTLKSQPFDIWYSFRREFYQITAQ